MNLFFHSRTHESIARSISTLQILELERRVAELEKGAEQPGEPVDIYRGGDHHQPKKTRHGRSPRPTDSQRRDETLPAENAQVLGVIGEALSRNVCVDIGYKSLRDSEASQRTVLPQDLVFNKNGHLMLVAARRNKDGGLSQNDYRTDRIVSAQLTAISAQSMLAGPIGPALAEPFVNLS